MIRHVVPAGAAPVAAEKYIRRAWPMVPGHAVRDLFKKKDVKLNGARCMAEDCVCGGDELLVKQIGIQMYSMNQKVYLKIDPDKFNVYDAKSEKLVKLAV